MRIIDLFEGRYPRKPAAEALAQAERDGFDISKLWFHGSGKRFDSFRLSQKDGIDELGPGVYLTSIKWLANTWARERGVIAICVIKNGPLFDLDRAYDPDCVQMMRDVSVQVALDRWVGDKPADAAAYAAEHFDEQLRARPKRVINRCLSEAGYVGAYKINSQIAGQVVIFDPSNVRIVARQGGKRYMSSDDP